MADLYDLISRSKLLILASPIHFSGPSSILKTAIDRFQPYWFNKERRTPAFCAALLCGGSPSPNFEISEKIFRAFSVTTGMKYLGALTVPDTDNGVEGLETIVPAFIGELRKEMA